METPKKPHHGHGYEHGTVVDTGLDSDEVAECPVMRGTVVAKTEAEENGLVREYGSQLYYLCCDTCAVLWDADPQQYVEQ